MRIAEILASIPLFMRVPPAQIEELTEILVDQTLARGATIFSEGDEAAGMYVVIQGRVKVFKISPEGKEQILHIFGFANPFGEAAMFTGGRFPAHAETLETTRLFFFPREPFIRLLEREPSLALNMLAALSMMLKQFTQLVENLALKEVPNRLAAYLLLLSENAGGADTLELDIPKGQLSRLLGTIPETFSRILAKMSSQGLIQAQGRTIRILDRPALEDLAAGGKSLV